MIHSQNVDITDKNSYLFGNMKGLSCNFVLTFFTVSTINSSMRSPSCCYAC